MIEPTPQGLAILQVNDTLCELFRCQAGDPAMLPGQHVTVMEAKQIMAEYIAPVLHGHHGHLVPHQRVEYPYLIALAQPAIERIP